MPGFGGEASTARRPASRGTAIPPAILQWLHQHADCKMEACSSARLLLSFGTCCHVSTGRDRAYTGISPVDSGFIASTRFGWGARHAQRLWVTRWGWDFVVIGLCCDRARAHWCEDRPPRLESARVRHARRADPACLAAPPPEVVHRWRCWQGSSCNGVPEVVR